MAQPAKWEELRQHTEKKNICAISITVLRVQIYNYFELGEGFEPSNVGFADRYVHNFATRALQE